MTKAPPLMTRALGSSPAPIHAKNIPNRTSNNESKEISGADKIRAQKTSKVQGMAS